MDFTRKAGRLTSHLWENEPVRSSTRSADDFKMRPWWSADLVDSQTGELNPDRVSHFGELSPSADVSLELMRGQDIESFVEKVVAIEHKFAIEAYQARQYNLSSVRASSSVQNPRTGGLLTPSMFGTAPSTCVPMTNYLSSLTDVDQRRKQKYSSIIDKDRYERERNETVRHSNLRLR